MPLVRDIAPDPQLPIDFVSGFLEDINYCDQSEAPPTKANQTHALLFAFHHHAPGHAHVHLYKGLLVYTPPRFSFQLGWFSGTGCLVAHPGQPEAVLQELDTVGGASRGASPWVRIQMAMGHSFSIDPETGVHSVWMWANFTFLGLGAGGVALGAPYGVQRSFEAEIHIKREGHGGGTATEGPLFMEVGTGGDQGRINFTRTTVVP